MNDMYRIRRNSFKAYLVTVENVEEVRLWCGGERISENNPTHGFSFITDDGIKVYVPPGAWVARVYGHFAYFDNMTFLALFEPTPEAVHIYTDKD